MSTAATEAETHAVGRAAVFHTPEAPALISDACKALSRDDVI